MAECCATFSFFNDQDNKINYSLSFFLGGLEFVAITEESILRYLA